MKSRHGVFVLLMLAVSLYGQGDPNVLTQLCRASDSCFVDAYEEHLFHALLQNTALDSNTLVTSGDTTWISTAADSNALTYRLLFDEQNRIKQVSRFFTIESVPGNLVDWLQRFAYLVDSRDTSSVYEFIYKDAFALLHGKERDKHTLVRRLIEEQQPLPDPVSLTLEIQPHYVYIDWPLGAFHAFSLRLPWPLSLKSSEEMTLTLLQRLKALRRTEFNHSVDGVSSVIAAANAADTVTFRQDNPLFPTLPQIRWRLAGDADSLQTDLLLPLRYDSRNEVLFINDYDIPLSLDDKIDQPHHIATLLFAYAFRLLGVGPGAVPVPDSGRLRLHRRQPETLDWNARGGSGFLAHLIQSVRWSLYPARLDLGEQTHDLHMIAYGFLLENEPFYHFAELRFTFDSNSRDCLALNWELYPYIALKLQRGDR
jgi:hypothetical protein